MRAAMRAFNLHLDQVRAEHVGFPIKRRQ